MNLFHCTWKGRVEGTSTLRITVTNNGRQTEEGCCCKYFCGKLAEMLQVG